jgi:hypothetical protein
MNTKMKCKIVWRPKRALEPKEASSPYFCRLSEGLAAGEDVEAHDTANKQESDLA